MVYGATAPAGPLAVPTRRRRGVAGLFVATLGGSLLLGLRVAGPSRARLATLVARPHTQTLVDPVDIRIAVSNEYGPCETDKYPFLYGIDDALLVEPHKTTSLTIENSVAGAAYAWTVGPYANPNDGVDGPSITVTYTKTGVHALSVEGTVDGTATTHRFTVYSKYVRREVRGLKDRDRLAFLERVEPGAAHLDVGLQGHQRVALHVHVVVRGRGLRGPGRPHDRVGELALEQVVPGPGDVARQHGLRLLEHGGRRRRRRALLLVVAVVFNIAFS